MKYVDIRGKAVVDRRGRMLGRVESAIINPDSLRISGLIVCSTLISTKYFIIPFRRVKFYKEFFEFGGRMYKIKRSILLRNKDIVLQSHIEKEVFDGKGRKLGKLIDVYIDILSGKFIAITISSGFFEDIFDGRKIIPIGSSVIFKERNIIINESSFFCRNDIVFKKFLRE